MKKYLILLLIALTSFNLLSQESEDLLAQGIDLFKRGLYNEAIVSFRGIIVDPNLTSMRGDAHFWIAKSNMAAEQLNEAETNLEYFLQNFKNNSNYSEGLYQKGRLLFLQQEYENSIQVLQSFINQYSNSVFISNAYFWIGEGLYVLGNFSEAQAIFRKIIEEYPNSFKYESAKYRLSLIEFKKRENELLKLLKWSHLESLETLEDFKTRESTYEQALSLLQKKLAIAGQSTSPSLSADTTQYQTTINQQESQIESLKKQITALESQIAALNQKQDSADDSNTVMTDAAIQAMKYQSELLKTKEEALKIQAELLDLLLVNLGE
ncbi:MAG: tetratricopeptide repeat protein [Spirochaetales bacterium]|nr:tetratricopeptide repeat protein [Spirochaetales bacterium]